MGDRYIITSVQVGQIFAYAEAGEEQRIKELLKDIQDKQFVENTANLLTKDIKVYANAKKNAIILKYLIKNITKDIKTIKDKLIQRN